MSDITITLSDEEAWTLYDLVTARSDLIARAEYEALTGLGGGTYHTLRDRLRTELKRSRSVDEDTK